jgi:ornithine carbamoyltransferase
MASVNALPIVNLLSDTGHPLQALADLLTVRQVHGGLHGVTLSFIGDFNNVAQSLTLAAALSGMNIRFGCPPAYAPGSEDLKRLVRLGATGAVAIHDAVEAAKGADVVYTDVWVAVGQEGETSTRLRDFAGFTVDRRVMDEALPGAIFLHCLPVRRGVEVAAEVVDGAASLVWQLARNRLSTARGLIQWLAGQPG